MEKNQSDNTAEAGILKDTLTVRIDLHKKYSINTYGWHNWVFDQFAFKDNMSVLELGCGTGDIWINRENRIPKSVQITLSDISPLISEKARENLYKNDLFSFQLLDIQNIPYNDNEFDMVIANHMLYNVPNLDRALGEIKRVLKNGAYFYASTVGVNSLRELVEIYKNYDGRVSFTNPRNNPFTLDNGEEKLRGYFTSIEKRLYPDSLAVTDADDLMDYIASYNDIPGDIYEEINRTIIDEINKTGAFNITKEQGMFVCVK